MNTQNTHAENAPKMSPINRAHSRADWDDATENDYTDRAASLMRYASRFDDDAQDNQGECFSIGIDWD